MEAEPKPSTPIRILAVFWAVVVVLAVLIGGLVPATLATQAASTLVNPAQRLPLPVPT